MPITIPCEYSSTQLPDATQLLLSILEERYSFSCDNKNGASKTTTVLCKGVKYGYINDTVIQKNGVIGYHFAKHGRNADACPKALEDNLIEFFCSRYQCNPSALIIHQGNGSDVGKTYLFFRDPQVALRVLLSDAGYTLEPEIQLAKVDQRFVEGKLVDITMQRRERNEEARSACLSAHGFSCYICQANLKVRYVGLPVEVIHVHHEEPLSQAHGEREFDPVATMKPVCPNCHCVIHSRTPPYSCAEVANMLKNEPQLVATN